MLAVGGACVYVCESACTCLCKGMHMLMHIFVPGSISGIIYQT